MTPQFKTASFCRHHPATNSRWQCEDCDRPLCDQCVCTAPRQPHPVCPNCGKPLEFRPNRADIEPFWQRLNDFFAFPFQFWPIVMLTLTVVASVFFDAGVIAGLVALIVVLMQIEYGLRVIATTSEGEFEAPSLLAMVTENEYGVVLKQFAVIAVMVILTGAISANLGPGLGMAFGVACLLVLPLSMIVLAIERSLGAALNPAILVESVYRIGWPYLLVCLYLVMMLACSLTFGDLALRYAGESMAQLITGASGYYFALVMYSLMGYLAYQYRYYLPFGANAQLSASAPAGPTEDPRVAVMLQQGDYTRAMALLRSEWVSLDHPAASIEKYMRIARFSGAWDEVGKHLAPLLTGLLDSGSTKGIPGFLRELLAAKPDAEIADTALAIRVADTVRLCGDSKLAARLLKNQHKLSRDVALQRESLERLAEILESDLDNAPVAAKYRALRDRLQDKPASDGFELALVD